MSALSLRWSKERPGEVGPVAFRPGDPAQFATATAGRGRPPPPEATGVDALRAALEQRTAEWRSTLRTEPAVARLLLRKLVGPLTLLDASDAEVPFDAPVTAGAALLDALYNTVASPTGFEP